MNAVEHIVECYFRFCRNCFTMTDVKIPGGNNRQCDLLAYNLETEEAFHVESSVTHDLTFQESEVALHDIFDRKFRGIPPRREGAKTDYAKGKTYSTNIERTYQGVGFDPAKIQRVFVTWDVKKELQLDRFLSGYFKEFGFTIQILLFRDRILPELMSRVSTSNYDDEVLRTLSLLRQREVQQARRAANPEASQRITA